MDDRHKQRLLLILEALSHLALPVEVKLLIVVVGAGIAIGIRHHEIGLERVHHRPLAEHGRIDGGHQVVHLASRRAEDADGLGMPQEAHAIPGIEIRLIHLPDSAGRARDVRIGIDPVQDAAADVLEANGRLGKRGGNIAVGLLDALANLVKRAGLSEIINRHVAPDFTVAIGHLEPSPLIRDEIVHHGGQPGILLIALKLELGAQPVQVRPSQLGRRQIARTPEIDGGQHARDIAACAGVGGKGGETRSGNLDDIGVHRRERPDEVVHVNQGQLFQPVHPLADLLPGPGGMGKLGQAERGALQVELPVIVVAADGAHRNEHAGWGAGINAASGGTDLLPSLVQVGITHVEPVNIVGVRRAKLPLAGDVPTDHIRVQRHVGLEKSLVVERSLGGQLVTKTAAITRHKIVKSNVDVSRLGRFR